MHPARLHNVGENAVANVQHAPLAAIPPPRQPPHVADVALHIHLVRAQLLHGVEPHLHMRGVTRAAPQPAARGTGGPRTLPDFRSSLRNGWSLVKNSGLRADVTTKSNSCALTTGRRRQRRWP